MPPAGSFSWHELATSDAEAAFSFYSDLFGWDVQMRMPLDGGETYVIFGHNGIQRGGIYNKPADMPAPPNWLHYAQVTDADEGWRTAESAGAKLVTGPMDVPGGSRIVTFFDPTGAAFAVASTPASAQPAETVAVKPETKSKPKAKAPVKAKAKATTTKAKAKVSTKVARRKGKAAKKSRAKQVRVVKKPASKKRSAGAKSKSSKMKVARKKTRNVRRKK
jgi:predicted enzyme related to lactoylglutathione lyase